MGSVNRCIEYCYKKISRAWVRQAEGTECCQGEQALCAHWLQTYIQLLSHKAGSALVDMANSSPKWLYRLTLPPAGLLGLRLGMTGRAVSPDFQSIPKVT